MKIGMNTFSAMKDEMDGLLAAWQEHINRAFLAAEDSFAINVKFTLKPDNGTIDLRTGISFVESRVKDETRCIVDEDQGNLFEQEGTQEKIQEKVDQIVADYESAEREAEADREQEAEF